jgi:putative membrane protein
MPIALASCVLLVLNQLIYTYPGDIRNARPIPLLIQAAIGIVQDTLIWLLVSWLNSEMHLGLHVDGFLTALLAGTVVRVSVLALLPLGPQPTTSTP